MKILKNLILILVFFTAPLSSSSAHAQNFPEKPSTAKFVNDFAKIYSDSEANFLEQKLLSYDNKTSTQIVIVTFTTLGGYPIDDYAIKLGNKWGVGQKGKDNGILILISSQDHKIFIASGYGMEGALNDGKIGTIIRSKIIPEFKNNNYFAGTNAGIDAMIEAAGDEFINDKSRSENKEDLSLGNIFGWIIILLFVIFTLKRRSLFGGAIIIGGSRFRSGGFGGGGFGGGGAGGSW